jgi:hypothetical protein
LKRIDFVKNFGSIPKITAMIKLSAINNGEMISSSGALIGTSDVNHFTCAVAGKGIKI